MNAKWSEHPSVVEGDGKLSLKVFRFLKTDKALPKNLVDGKVVYNGKEISLEEYYGAPDEMSEGRRFEVNQKEGRGKAKEGLWARIIGWFKKKPPKDAPPETFQNAKAALERNALGTDGEALAKKLEGIIGKLLANGQVALAKRLGNEKSNIVNETVLAKNGLFRYLTEEDAINLLKTADFGIRIDFWNDYPELVPDEVLEAKRKADELKVFDNWCVMHYDPDGSALKQIKTEEWRRDPILFGMIVGSDRLYFVKDWKTEKDALTIDKVCGLLNIPKLRDARDYGAKSEYGRFLSARGVLDEIVPVDRETAEESVGSV